MKIEVRKKASQFLFFCASVWESRCNTESYTQSLVRFIGAALACNFPGLSTVNFLWTETDPLQGREADGFYFIDLFCRESKDRTKPYQHVSQARGLGQ